MTPQQSRRIEALAGLIDLLDLLDGDPDLEPETDCCAAGDDAPVAMRGDRKGIGDETDAECNGDLELPLSGEE